MAAEPTTLRRSRNGRNAITAAAIRFDDFGGGDAELSRQVQRHERWQDLAWGYYDEVGEVGFAVDMRAEQLARCPLTVVARPEPDAPVVPATDPDSGASIELANFAEEILRDFKAPVGGQKQIIRQAQANTAVAGEWYLLHYDGAKENLHGWHVRSSEDITVTASKIESKGLGEFALDQVSRVWQPHPRRFELANSGLRRVLSRCETVMLIDRQFRGSLRSRLFAGLLLLSNGFRTGMEPTGAETAGDGEAQLDPVIADMLAAISLGIQDEGSASAVAPNTLWGAIEDVKDGARLLEFAQQVDLAVEQLRTSELRRIAQGLDEPAAIVLGETNENHWNLWWIGEQAVEMAQPKAEFLADAFTTVFLHPELLANIDADPAEIAKLEVALDLTPLRKRPNASEDIITAYDKGEAAGRALRRVLQIPESDAPDEYETERWLILNKGNVGSNLTTELIRRNIAPDLPDIAADPVRGTTPGADAPIADGPPPIPAAARDTSPPARNRLSAIDISLTERLFAASLAAFRRALDVAGNRAKAKVASAHREIVKDVAAAQVIATIRGAVEDRGLTEEELLAGALVALRVDFDRWVSAAQADALDAAIAMSGTEPDEGQVEELTTAQATDREDAWEWFAGASTALLIERMANGQGLNDWEVRDLVRRSLARAGGADELAPFEPGQVPADGYGTGLATGPLILGVLVGLGIAVTSWEWVHGEPAHPFPPHVELHGDVESTRDAFGDEPGSHKGCTCTIQPRFEEATQ